MELQGNSGIMVGMAVGAVFVLLALVIWGLEARHRQIVEAMKNEWEIATTSRLTTAYQRGIAAGRAQMSDELRRKQEQAEADEWLRARAQALR